MDIKDVKTYLADSLSRVEGIMSNCLRSDISLLDATNRSLMERSGKMLRPMLCLLVSGACSGCGPTPDSEKFAAATELLHNATLLHDDVVDSGGERRGKPTVMSILGSPASVLIGDFWLVKAMDTIFSAGKCGDVIIRIFAKTLSDLAEGEMLQLQKTGSCDTTEADYLRIIYCKTASLFEAAAISGALSVGADETLLEAVRSYARNLGIAFQIRDDMLDYSSSDNLGKPSGVDILEQKITMPLLAALSSVSSEEASSIREKVSEVIETPSVAEDIKKFVSDHDGLSLARKKLEGFISEAIKSLSSLPSSKEKSYLAFLAEYVGGRSS